MPCLLAIAPCLLGLLGVVTVARPWSASHGHQKPWSPEGRYPRRRVARTVSPGWSRPPNSPQTALKRRQTTLKRPQSGQPARYGRDRLADGDFAVGGGDGGGHIGGGAQHVDVGEPVPQGEQGAGGGQHRGVGCDRRLFAWLPAGHQNVGGKSPVSWTTDCGKRAALNAKYPYT